MWMVRRADRRIGGILDAWGGRGSAAVDVVVLCMKMLTLGFGQGVRKVGGWAVADRFDDGAACWAEVVSGWAVMVEVDRLDSRYEIVSLGSSSLV